MSLPPVTRRVLLFAAAAVLAAGVAACSSAAARPESGPPAARPTSAELEATKRALDERAAAGVPATVTTWGIDPGAGVVVVTVSGPRTAEVDRFLAGLDPRTLRVDTDARPVRPLPGTGVAPL